MGELFRFCFVLFSDVVLHTIFISILSVRRLNFEFGSFSTTLVLFVYFFVSPFIFSPSFSLSCLHFDFNHLCFFLLFSFFLFLFFPFTFSLSPFFLSGFLPFLFLFFLFLTSFFVHMPFWWNQGTCLYFLQFSEALGFQWSQIYLENILLQVILFCLY